MGNYTPTPPPELKRPDDIREYLHRELRRVGDQLSDDADTVFFRTLPTQVSLSAGISANWRISGNLLLISTSITQTLTGIQRSTQLFADHKREIVIINVGTGVLSMKSAASESSASNQFLLPSNYQLSANAACTVWRDPFAAKWRAISRT